MIEIQDHFNHLRSLIELEREEEVQEYQKLFETIDLKDQEKKGFSLIDLKITDQVMNKAHHWLVTFKKFNDENFPIYSLDVGNIVLLYLMKNMDLSSIPSGTVYDKWNNYITVSFSSPISEDYLNQRCYLQVDSTLSTYRTMQKALDYVETLTDPDQKRLREILLGNKPAEFDPIKSLPRIEYLNQFQQEAVEKSMAAKDIFLIHGPPGTGKTTVLMEVIRQSVLLGKKILATAPSNTACDHLLDLCIRNNISAVRLGHPARIQKVMRDHTLDFLMTHTETGKTIDEIQNRIEELYANLPKNKKGYANHEMMKEIRFLKKEIRSLKKNNIHYIVHKNDVVIATHTGCASKDIRNSKFDLIVMDEASQSTEPLAWVPFKHASKIVFAGDHCQLPPTVRSKEAEIGGLHKTIFERLIHQVPSECKTLLRIQYRMHEKIMGFSSQQFYQNLLIADQSVAQHSLIDDPTVKKNEATCTPMTFVDTSGCGYEEELEEGSESRFNIEEANLLYQELQNILNSGVEAKNIGIISAYNAQVRYLRYLVNNEAIEIYSVDKFQGREKDVILLSLVRSNLTGELGFLGDTKRMNVALTRARKKLWVIGDGATLSSLKFYKDFIEYSESVGAYQTAWELL